MSNLAEQENAVPETVKKESKQYFKITFQDIEIAEEFFENEKHLNEFLIATMNYYRGKESVIKTKIVKKYFETYKKTMNVIIKAREFGKKGAEKRAENQVVNPDTLEGVVKGSVLDPLSTKESNIIKEINVNNITEEVKSYYRVIKHLKISNEEIEKLKLSYSIEQINSVLDDIENYPKNKNYTSLYLTACKWLKKNKVSVTSEHEWFLPWFNNARLKLNLSNNYTMSDKIKNNLYNLKDKTKEDFAKAYKNMVNDEWMKKDGYKYLDPEYTTRKDVFERYLNLNTTKTFVKPITSKYSV